MKIVAHTFFILQVLWLSNKKVNLQKSFSMETSTVENQIHNFLSLLTPEQKETVLNVVKTIALAGQEYESLWDDESFRKEIDSRTDSYESGTASLYKFEEMKKDAISNYEQKGNKR